MQCGSLPKEILYLRIESGAPKYWINRTNSLATVYNHSRTKKLTLNEIHKIVG
jgi:hypothetical protein